MRNYTLVSAITICASFVLHAQTPRVAGGFSTDWEHLTIETRQLAANVYLLHGSGGNTLALIGPEGKLLVDTEFAQAAPRLKEALDKLDAGKVRYVISTHYHGDHTGANAAFHGDGATIIGQETPAAHDPIALQRADRHDLTARAGGEPANDYIQQRAGTAS